MTLQSLYDSIEKDYKKITKELEGLIKKKNDATEEVKKNITLTKQVKKRIDAFIKNQREFLQQLLYKVTDIQKKTTIMGEMIDEPDNLINIITMNVQLLENYRKDIMTQIKTLG